MLGTEETLRLTVAALMSLTGERQADVGAGIGLSQVQVSRRQAGRAAWSLTDVDRLAAHWGMQPLDLLAGPTHAAGRLQLSTVRAAGPAESVPAERPTARAPVPEQPAGPAPVPEPAPTPTEPEPAPSARPGDAGDLAATVGAPVNRLRREAPEATPAPALSTATPAASKEREVPHRPAPAQSLTGTFQSRVAAALREAGGDVDVAKAALVKRAIPDVMALFASSRVGGRYEHSEFPPTADVLQKASQKGADEIWEGRPKWRAQELHRCAREGLISLEVTALDMNAAYLAAFKCWLPIGKLVRTEGDLHDPKRSGVHLVTPPLWSNEDLPNPLGDRKLGGDLWIPEPLLRLLLDCAKKGLCDPPVIRESFTSGASEALLEKLRRALKDTRIEAIENGDDVTVEYVKSMYSKFVSTIGESTANRDIRRPDWMHIIRSQAFANLWRKAHKAHTSGLTVVQMAGTDELHVAGDWRQVFPEGRDLVHVKAKNTYTLGGDL